MYIFYSELRNNLASYMDEVCDSRAALHVTRQNARTVVMISEDEYEAMMETLHLLKSPGNPSPSNTRCRDGCREGFPESIGQHTAYRGRARIKLSKSLNVDIIIDGIA
jgi:prevent-host-death family protein